MPGSAGGAKFRDFPLFPGTGPYWTDAAERPFVSLLHTGGTGPAGSDPIPGKQETAFC
jgi:hypothetical protein